MVMPYGSVTGEGLFKLADINMEKRRMAEAQKTTDFNQGIALRQDARAQATFDQQQAQAKENLQLLNNKKELDVTLAKAMSGTAPGEAFNAGWDSLNGLTADPKFAPLIQKTREELLGHQMELLNEFDKRDPSKKMSTSVFNQTVGKQMGFQISEIKENKEGTFLMGKAINPDTQKEEDAYIVQPKDGSAPTGIRFMPSGFDPADKSKETWRETNVMRDGKPVIVERSNLGNERFVSSALPAKDKTGTDGISAGYKQERELRNDFIGQSKDFLLVRDAYSRIKASAKDPSAAGDLSLIFNYMKVLDPGSTVREGEFATAQNSAGVPGRVVSAYNKVISGERLNNEQRGDFVNRSSRLYQSMNENHKKRESEFTRLAKNSGLDPRNVIQDVSLVETGDNKPETTIVPFEGLQVQAQKAPDGFYYVEKGGKFFKYTPEVK